MFSPESEYTVVPGTINIKDFHDYEEDFVVRPPYQRKNVWSRKKQQALLDSLFRRYYIPCIVLREVRLGPQEVKKEVIDGQQRIHRVQRFFRNELPLPDTLADLNAELPARRYSDLDVGVRKFVDKELVFAVDHVKGIDDPLKSRHQHVATEIFWRLQQGESLNMMEIAHARLSSTCRNFVVKYADEIGFDFDSYEPVDENPHKHPFFTIIERNNDRMQHLALLTRLLIMEDADGPADIQDRQVAAYIDEFQTDNGVGNVEDFEARPESQAVRRNLDTFYRAFEDDPMLDEKSGIKELRIEYFIISIYLLLRHLRRYYVLEQNHLGAFRDFTYEWHDRWRTRREEDSPAQAFVASRQQSRAEIETRHRIIRQLFFEYCGQNDIKMVAKDTKRAFSEAERIAIYRRDNGLCQACIAEGKPEQEARVSWSEFEADHVLPHCKGGDTVIENGQVLCSYHNKVKGGSVQQSAGE